MMNSFLKDVVQRSVCPKPCKAAPRSSEHKLMTMGQEHRPTAGQINPTLNETPSVWIGKKDPTKESSTAIRMYLPPTGHVWKTALRKPSTRKEWTETKGGKGKDSIQKIHARHPCGDMWEREEKTFQKVMK